MTDAFVRTGMIADAHKLAEDMRPHDAEECRAFGREPLEALLLPFLSRQQVFTISDPDFNVYAMFGISDMITWGCPWMLTSNKFPLIARPFAKRSKLYFDMMSKEHLYLENLVSANNTVAHRWLKHLGFTIEKDRGFEQAGITFFPFWKYTHV